MDSVIYRDLSRAVAEQCGYFEPKEKLRLLDEDEFYGASFSVNERTQFIYFPGSFGTFHEGHVSVAKAAMAKYPKAKLIISPANSDYTVQKYGAWSRRASNKHRYEAIKKALPNAIIDFDPMLNHRCDQNFTDLLEQYLLGHGLILNQMETAPIILAGKDRADWLGLNTYHSYIKVEHFEDTTGASTSAMGNIFRRKKHLFLRVNNLEEAKLFRHYFADQYMSIQPLLIGLEIGSAAKRAASGKYTHTICKEYASFLPYIKLSRTFTNPFEDATFDPDDNRIQKGMVILDSDVYSGATKRFVQSKGAKLEAIYDSIDTNTTELLDIDDFRDEKFCYPYVDISSRCSMQAFDFDFHRHFKAFKAELNRVP